MEQWSNDDFYSRIIKKLNNKLNLNESDMDYIIEWNNKIGNFHKERLELIKCKQLSFLTYVNNCVNKLILEKNSNIDISREKNELNLQFVKWIENGNTFQINNDQKQKAERIYSWSGYFKAVRDLLIALGETIYIVKPMFPSLNYNNFKLLYTLVNNNYYSTQINTTPFTTKLCECLRLWAIEEDIIVKVEGEENLKSIYHNQTQIPVVNLFLPSHRSPIPDALVLGYLNLPHCILCGNPAMFAGVPEKLKIMIASVPEFIPIGKLKDEENPIPIKKLIKSLKSGISRNVINYPQGFVPSAGEILPISKVFVEKCLAPLLIAGFNVKIYPIAYEVESEFLLARENHKGMIYTIKYGKVLEPETVRKLVQLQLGDVLLVEENLDNLLNGNISGTGEKKIQNVSFSSRLEKLDSSFSPTGEKIFDHYLLNFWNENIIAHGELSLEELIDRATKKFGFNLYRGLAD